MRLRAFALTVSLSAVVCGCSRTADEDQCKKLVDKLVDLMAEGSSDHVDKVKNDVKRDKRSAVLSRETCVGKITRSQYECMMAAKSLETFAACEK
jgi:hypothetical protein